MRLLRTFLHGILMMAVLTLGQSKAAEALVSFTFDDVPKSVATIGMPILAAKGYPATLYVTTGNTVFPGYMNWDDIGTAVNLGWEVAAHTHKHRVLTDLTDAEILDDLLTSAELFAEHGYAPKHFASPLGEFDDRVLAILKRHFQSHRTGWPDRVNRDTLDPYKIASYVIRNTTTIEEIRGVLGDLRNRGGWVVFQLHHISLPGGVMKGAFSTSIFPAIVEEVHAGGFQVLTISDALQQLQKGVK